METTNTSESFMGRLLRERDELKDKCEKLTSFLSDKEKAIKIAGIVQVELLVNQLYFMDEYLCILEERIEDLQKPLDK